MRSVVFALVILLMLSGRSESWTSKTYQLIVVKSLRLMPVTFQNIMLQHKVEILSGCLRPDELSESDHLYDLSSRQGYLLDRVTELTKIIPEKVRTHHPFREIAVDFGRLAHYISDLNDPLLLEDSDPREPQYRQDFPVFLEKNLPKFPWVFDGHDNSLLNEDHLKDYVHSIAAEAVEKYSQVGDSYFPEGKLVSSDTFDWKSLPFGVASLSYSHSISDTVQIWFYCWKLAHGDTTFTPYYSKKHSSIQ
jgi:hypothetical protein